MSIDPSVMSFLSGGGGKTVSFLNVGDSVKGAIISAEERQQTEIGTNDLKTWPDGKPKMELVIRLQTEERDPTDPDDDGIRNLYVSGSRKPESKSKTAALAAAVQSSGAKTLAADGILAMKYVGDGVPSQRGFNPPKLYEAAYRPPALPTGGLLDDAPAASPAAAPVAPASDPLADL